MQQSIDIFVVDDHEILRDGIRALLLGSSINILADFEKGSQLFERLAHQQPNLILLDITMGEMSGLDILDHLQEEYPNIPVLMLSADSDEERIRAAVQKGALGFLPKDCSKNELIKGIQTVSKHQNYFGNSILSVIFKDYVKSTRLKSEEPELTDRERKIVQLLCEGMSHKEIGEQLHISHRTVESSKKTIFDKLGIDNNMQLMKYAIKQGITDL